MTEFRKFVPFIKVDAAKREVSGVVTAEVKDKSGEVCDYFGTKPYFQAWSAEFEKATDGKSVGNLRLMHTTTVVGKGLGIEFRDDAREIFMTFKVTDDKAWSDVEEGVLTGFSQGGRYVKLPDKDGKYVASPSEVSLVDNPALGVCHFAYIKADGAVEMRKVRSTELGYVPPRDGDGVPPGAPSAAAKAETADAFSQAVTLPAITVEQCLRAARGEDPQLTPEQMKAFELLRTVISRSAPVSNDTAVKTDAAVATDPPAKKPADPEIAAKAAASLVLVKAAIEEVKKGMYAVSSFASLLEELRWLQFSAQFEAEREGDESQVPVDLLAQLKELCRIFLDMAEEESTELLANPDNAGECCYALNSDLRKTSDLLTKAAEKIHQTNAGTPAKGATMADTQTGTELNKAAGLLDHLKKAKAIADDHHEKMTAHIDKCMKAMGGDDDADKAAKAAADAAAAVQKTAEPGDLAKAQNEQFATVLKGMEDKFMAFMAKLGETLEPPKAAVTATGTVVTKTQDNAGGGETVVHSGEPVFKAQGAPTIAVSDDYRKAMKSIAGVAYTE